MFLGLFGRPVRGHCLPPLFYKADTVLMTDSFVLSCVSLRKQIIFNRQMWPKQYNTVLLFWCATSLSLALKLNEKRNILTSLWPSHTVEDGERKYKCQRVPARVRSRRGLTTTTTIRPIFHLAPPFDGLRVSHGWGGIRSKPSAPVTFCYYIVVVIGALGSLFLSLPVRTYIIKYRNALAG